MKGKRIYQILVVLVLVAIFIGSNIMTNDKTDLTKYFKLHHTNTKFTYIKEKDETVFSVDYEWEWLKKPPANGDKYDCVRFSWSKDFIKYSEGEDTSFQHIIYSGDNSENQVSIKQSIKGYENGIIVFPQETNYSNYPLKGNGNITIKKHGKIKDVGVLITYLRGKESDEIELNSYKDLQIVDGITIVGEDFITK